ncbi:aspartic peptidase A1 [Amanita rubescens]|nr:aspartic peptidase A1 [Amanita rubescens]
MFSKLFRSILLLALTIAANGAAVHKAPVKLSIARHLNTTGVAHVLQHDQARARHLKARVAGESFASVVNEPVTNQAVIYTASVGVGNPATSYTLIVDTGSSNTWVGANKAFHATSTSHETGDTVSVNYGSGSFSGNEWIDQVTLGSLVIPQQSIGVATRSTGFFPYDGILGIGPVDLTIGTLSPHSSSAIPTVTDNLDADLLIPTDLVAVSFEPTSTSPNTNGELTWGGVDSTQYTGTINYAPLTATFPANQYWGIDESIVYGSTTILSTTAGIVDTGTTLILIATDAYNSYQSLTGGVFDFNTGLLKITSTQYSNLKTLTFNIHGVGYGLTPNGQIWPRALNSAIGGTAGSIYLVVQDIGSPSGSGLDFIDGYTFLERFYSVFDTTNQRIGFATTPFTTATTN